MKVKNPDLTTRFTVEGANEFPFDMLRYDGCYPADSQSAAAITAEGRRRVELASCQSNTTVPTVARWKSFLWRVMETKQ